MFLTITTSKVNAKQAPMVEAFLKEFLPKFSKFPGVVAIYHYTETEKESESTVVIWESEEAIKAYWASDLIDEPIAFEKANNLASTREKHRLVFTLP